MLQFPKLKKKKQKKEQTQIEHVVCSAVLEMYMIPLIFVYVCVCEDKSTQLLS